jgi:hypothetical protein
MGCFGYVHTYYIYKQKLFKNIEFMKYIRGQLTDLDYRSCVQLHGHKVDKIYHNYYLNNINKLLIKK